MAWNLATGTVVGALVAGLARVVTGRQHMPPAPFYSEATSTAAVASKQDPSLKLPVR